MALSVRRRLLAPAEFLAIEQGSDQKHEYFRGEIFAMAGAGLKHNLVCGNLIGALRERLRGRRCVALPSDQLVYVESTGLATYPDVTVVCGSARTHRDFPRAVVNPSVLVEALSASTERYDRGDKWDHYARIESLREYVLVSTEKFAVDHFLREASGSWRVTMVRGADAVLRLPSLDVAIPLAEIYENIDVVAPDGGADDEVSGESEALERPRAVDESSGGPR